MCENFRTNHVMLLIICARDLYELLLQEFPAIRFRAAAPPGEEFPPGLESRLLVAQRIAVELHEKLLSAQRSGVTSLSVVTICV